MKRRAVFPLVLSLLAIMSCGGVAEREGECDPPKPKLDLIEPSSIATHSPSVLLTVSGSNFVPNSVVFFDGHAVPTTYVSSTQLRATVPFDLLLKIGPVPVDVFNPVDSYKCGSAGYQVGLSQVSNALTFTLK